MLPPAFLIFALRGLPLTSTQTRVPRLPNCLCFVTTFTGCSGDSGFDGEDGVPSHCLLISTLQVLGTVPLASLLVLGARQLCVSMQ